MEYRVVPGDSPPMRARLVRLRGVRMAMFDEALERLTLPIKSLKVPDRLSRSKFREVLRRRNLAAHGERSLLRGQRSLRAIFISDVHLGTRGCKDRFLLDFLRHHDCETLYLVGDIVDGWRLKRSWFWNDAHNEVIREILRKAHEGTRVVYIPGNHDEVFRDYVGLNLGGIDVQYEAIHETADGKKLLVIHGDHFDGVVKYAKWLALMGDWAYAGALTANDGLNAVRRRLGLPYWSLSAYLKHKVKNAVEYVSNFKSAVAREAASRGLDGVVCGHIHQAEVTRVDGVLYLNDGDWVESCTSLVEDFAGNLSIVGWAHVLGDSEDDKERAERAVA
jgi:UDP-2,3-diacylglucosamine pyrophosphatase LpxH